MKTCLSVVAMIVVLTVFAWGQNAPTSSDASGIEKEMGILSGIIRSELESHFRINLGVKVNEISNTVSAFNAIASFFSVSNPIWFYLPEQGAVLTVPVYGIRNSSQMLKGLSNPSAPSGLPEVLNRLQFEFFTTLSNPSALSNPGEPPDLTKLFPALDQPDIDNTANNIRETVRNLEASIQQDIGAAHEDLVKARQTINELNNELQTLQSLYSKAANLDETLFRGMFDSLRNPLVDILAKYGDSLSFVKPDEYINLVIYTPSLMDISGRQQRVDVISARKSWITDYKAGRMTLEEFREKIP